MNALNRALWAENLKLKRTLALGMAFLAPLVIVVMQFFLGLERGQYMYSEGEDTWILYTQQTIMLWSLLMLPLFVTLETALLTGFEHSSGTWKQLYALPVPRWSILAAKQIFSMLLIGLSMLVLVVLTFASGIGLRLLRPEMNFSLAIPWKMALERIALAYLVAWPIIAIHTWVSTRWPGYVIPFGAGIAATIGGLLLINSDWASYYPWTMPGVVVNQLSKSGAVETNQLLFGVAGGLLIFLASNWALTRRDVL